jgi:hypothetical protein
MTNRTDRFLAPVVAIALLFAPAAFAADPAKAPTPAPTAEQREQMAAAHQKMAECLRSDRPTSDCRADMMKNAHGMKGDMGCSMECGGQHGMRRHGTGSTGGGMMKGEPTPEAPKP